MLEIVIGSVPVSPYGSVNVIVEVPPATGVTVNVAEPEATTDDAVTVATEVSELVAVIVAPFVPGTVTVAEPSIEIVAPFGEGAGDGSELTVIGSVAAVIGGALPEAFKVSVTDEIGVVPPVYANV